MRRCSISGIWLGRVWMLLCVFPSWLHAEALWQTIKVPTVVEYRGQTWQTGCADGSPYEFYVRQGNPQHVMMYMSGGGACWDFNTCVGSVLAGQPVYTPAIVPTDPNQSVALAAGIFDQTQAANPVRNYTQVVLPYCTGDVYWGQADCDYVPGGPPQCQAPGTLPPVSRGAMRVQHRGFANLVAVLIWLYTQGTQPDDVLVAGSSAGGYGALLAFPAVRRLWSETRTQASLLVDGAAGVLSADFYERALGGRDLRGGVWGVERTIPGFLQTALASSGAALLPVTLYRTLAQRYPGDRFGAYTSAFDQVQIVMFNVMQHVEAPQLWTDPELLYQATLEWALRARVYLRLIARAPNVRFYLAPGSGHALLLATDDSQMPGNGALSAEDPAQGISFSAWLADMLQRPPQTSPNWRNVNSLTNAAASTTPVP